MAKLEISLVQTTPRERATEAQLERLLGTYNLEPWIRTRRIVIEEGAIPHSHPVLTINTRHLDNDELLLATFLHEQIHWLVLERQEQLGKAIAEIAEWLPDIAVGHPAGANDKRGSYLHVVVNYLEWVALEQIVGAKRARDAIDFWRTDHYTALYGLIIEHRERIAHLVTSNSLFSPTGTESLQ